jgi:hypothetical protein
MKKLKLFKFASILLFAIFIAIINVDLKINGQSTNVFFLIGECAIVVLESLSITFYLIIKKRMK